MLRANRDLALRGAGLFAVALGAWGLDAVTAGVCHSNSIAIVIWPLSHSLIIFPVPSILSRLQLKGW